MKKLKHYMGLITFVALVGSSTGQSAMVVINSWKPWGFASTHMGSPGALAAQWSCILLIPLCFLNKNSKGTESVLDRDELIEEYGYSEDQADLLISEQRHLTRRMKDKRLRLVIKEEDTARTIKSQIKSVYKEANPFFLDSFVEHLGFDEQ